MKRSLLLLLVVAVACTPPDEPIDGASTWVGTITTEGDVTTVINESGSVWGGTATLVDEVSIGVEAGPDEYMLGRVVGVFATNERIFVVDRQVPIIRVYDGTGVHVGNIGRAGQGPGEFTRPESIAGDGKGRIFVRDAGSRTINVFSESGEHLETWPAENAATSVSPLVTIPDGNLWARVYARGIENPPSNTGLQAIGPDGPTGEIRFPAEKEVERLTVDVSTGGGRVFPSSVPFSPQSRWAIAYSGAIVTGASDTYGYEIQRPDGSLTVMEKRDWVPVPIQDEEADWYRRSQVAGVRSEAAADWTWDGAEIPTTKPAFLQLIPATSGDVWIVRQGIGEPVDDCVDDPIEAGAAAARANPCWRDRTILDVFDEAGRYLGGVQSPTDLRPTIWPAHLNIGADWMVVILEDDAGTIMVKRYRLVLPGEER